LPYNAVYFTYLAYRFSLQNWNTNTSFLQAWKCGTFSFWKMANYKNCIFSKGLL